MPPYASQSDVFSNPRTCCKGGEVKTSPKFFRGDRKKERKKRGEKGGEKERKRERRKKETGKKGKVMEKKGKDKEKGRRKRRENCTWYLDPRIVASSSLRLSFLLVLANYSVQFKFLGNSIATERTRMKFTVNLAFRFPIELAA